MPVSKKRKKIANRRPTPPKKADPVADKGPSPVWYVALMFGLMGLGVLIILTNYVVDLPFISKQIWLMIGLVGLASGFAMTLNYR